MHWFVDNKDSDLMQSLLKTHELWVMPIMNVDGYDYTFTCGDHVAVAVMCNGLPATNDNRLWRKNLRDNNGNGLFGDDDDGVDPNRNYATGWNLDPEGSSGTIGSETYRGPSALSEPENKAYDRLLRRVDFVSLVNYHSAAQLLLYPFGSYTDYSSTDDSFFKAITGTYGDAAVDPYISQRSSDLYVTNGETVEHGYAQYGVLGWTPELDECGTGGGIGCQSNFVFPDEEDKVQGVFLKNLDFALNVAVSAKDPEEPRNADSNPSTYRVKPTRRHRADADERLATARRRRSRRSPRSRSAASSSRRRSRAPGCANRTITTTATPFEGGERLGDRPGRAFQRVRVTTPARTGRPPTQTARFATPGDIVVGDDPRRRPVAVLPLPRRGGAGHAGRRRAAEEARARGGGRGLHRRVAEPAARLRRGAALPAARTSTR